MSSELSNTKPDDILVTDFFGGVASVEISPSSEMLSPLGRSFARWSEAEAKAERGYPRGQLSAMRPAQVRGWRKPLQHQAGLKDGVMTGMMLGLGALFTWVMVRPVVGTVY